MKQPEPLYRRVNTRTHGVLHGPRGEARWERQKTKAVRDQSALGSMHGGRRLGRDYTPLFKFLLSRVGTDWDETYGLAIARLDSPEPIFWLVARSVAERKRIVALDHNSYYSGLWVDDDNRLALVDPDLRVEDLTPNCACCTHTLNGVRFTRPYRTLDADQTTALQD